MRLRPNEFCPFTDQRRAVGGNSYRDQTDQAWKFSELKIRVTRVDIGNSDHPAEMRKLMNRKIVEQSGICPICHEEFTNYNDIVPDHREPKGWKAGSETTIQATCRQHTSGAMERKDPPGLTNDCRSADSIFERQGRCEHDWLRRLFRSHTSIGAGP